MTRLEDLPDDQLIGCWRRRRSDATEAEGEAYRLRDEAVEIANMLRGRGYKMVAPDEWEKRTPPAGGEVADGLQP